MDAEQLRSIQAPFKARYRDTPDQALITVRAQGRLGEGVHAAAAQSGAATPAADISAQAGVPPFATPAAQRLITENELDIAAIPASGSGNRILKEGCTGCARRA